MDIEPVLIPAKIIYNWDFRKYLVSKKAASFLAEFRSQPFIDLKVNICYLERVYRLITNILHKTYNNTFDYSFLILIYTLPRRLWLSCKLCVYALTLLEHIYTPAVQRAWKNCNVYFSARNIYMNTFTSIQLEIYR